MINLVTNDGARLESIVYFLPYIVIAPVQAIVIVNILILKIDKSFLSGLFLLLVLIPVQSIFAKAYSHFRYEFDCFYLSQRTLLNLLVKQIEND